jgi:transcriptional regulator GlxA family with amidase domain
LAKAGLLDGKKATTWAGGEADLKSQFNKVDVQFDTNVVVDGNIITSNGSLVSYQAALVLLSKIASPSKAQEVSEAIQYQRFSQAEF